MCALSSELVTFLIERSGLNIKQLLKKKRKKPPNLIKKESKDRFTDQNVFF